MLSIGSMSEDSGQYYMELAREDYYLAGGEPPGQWLGKGAEQLGMTGQVQKDYFYNLIDGIAPEGTAVLVGTSNGARHHPGWDLTFSAPKSVSVVWSQADQAMRTQIQQCQQEAVKKAIEYLEEEAAVTRRGKGGVRREHADLVVATFEHGTSRAQDPQLHTHALVLNLGLREDGNFGALDGTELYKHKMAAGAVYRAELARQIEQRLGFRAEQHDRAFEIVGVDKKLIREFSKRREAIERELKSLGLDGAKAASIAALETRAVKEHLPREQLLREWQEIGRQYGFGREQVRALVQLPRPMEGPQLAANQAATAALRRLSTERSFFTKRDLVRYTAEESQYRGVGADGARKAANQLLRSAEVVFVGRHKRDACYATRETLAIEQGMLTRVEQMKTSTRHQASEQSVARVLRGDPDLRPEQQKALRRITRDAGAVQGIDGLAGTGKTRLLGRAREVWEAEGRTVMGAAVSGKAARGLSDGAGIRSSTVASLRMEFDPEYAAQVRAKSPSPRQGSKAATTPPRKWDHHTVLVVDEASMLGTRDLGWLVSESQRRQSKLVLVGDRRQLPAIEAGGGYAAIAKRAVFAELKEVVRQTEQWARDAVKEMAEGDVEAALRAYHEQGLVDVSQNRTAAGRNLVSTWSARGVDEPAQHVMFASTNAETRALNRLAQQKRQAAGRLGTEYVRAQGYDLRAGDRVLCGKNSRTFGVDNGMTGTIVMVAPGSQQVVVDLDDGRRQVFPLARYDHLQLGYAVTAHKGQGMTVDNSYILMGGMMQDREMAYVQMSRARGKTHLFINTRECGEDLRALIGQLTQSHTKELASSLRDQEVAQGRRPYHAADREPDSNSERRERRRRR